jgi:sugar phosphate isomerase/epimerase
VRRTSLAHFTVVDATPVELIDAAAAGGFDHAGLRIVPPFPTDRITPVAGDRAMLQQIKARLAATGVSLLDIEAFWINPETDIEAWLPALDAGAELGARYVLSVGFDPEERRLIEKFCRFTAAVGERGMRPMLEFIPYSSVKSLEAAHALITAAGGVPGILVDALHLSRSGGSPADIAAYDAALFDYVHLCDAPRMPPPSPEQIRVEAREGRELPGEGGLWLSEFIAAFAPETAVAVEAPTRRYAHLPPPERGRLAGEAMRRVLE